MAYAPCEVTLAFGDGDYLFRLPLKQIAELQLLCGPGGKEEIGIGTIYRRVMTGDYFVQDLHQTIRLGLIGGGTPALKARVLCDNYVEGLPKQELWKLASAVLSSCIVGYEKTEEDKEPGNVETPTTTDTLTTPGLSETASFATEELAQIPLDE